MILRLLFALVILLPFISCTKKTFLSSNVTPSEIIKIAVFEPISYINLINKGDKAVHSDSLSQISQQLWLNTVELNRYRLPIDTIIALEDEYKRYQLQEETLQLFTEVHSMERFYSLPIPAGLKSQLELTGHRFGMLTLTSGFTRRKGNLTGQMIKSIAIGIVTMGMVMILPETAQSNVHVLILDNDMDEVVYYKASMGSEMQPLKEKSLHRQLDYLYKDYFW